MQLPLKPRSITQLNSLLISNLQGANHLLLRDFIPT